MKLPLILFVILVFLFFACDSGFTDKTPEKSKKTLTDSSLSNGTSGSTIAGTYSFGTSIETGSVGSLIIYPVSDSIALFYLDLCKGAPSYNLGQLAGKIRLNGNTGVYIQNDDLTDCRLLFRFDKDEVSITTESGHDQCGFGNGVSSDHTYLKKNSYIQEYYISGEGDTVLFRDIQKKF